MVSLQVGTEDNKVKDATITTRVIGFSVSANNNTKRVKLTCDNAFAMAEVIHQMFLIGCEHELKREINSDNFKNQSKSNNQNNFGNSNNQSNINDNSNNNMGDDDNSSFLGNQFGGGGFGGNPFS